MTGCVDGIACPIGDGGPNGVLLALALTRPPAHPMKTAANNTLVLRCISISPRAKIQETKRAWTRRHHSRNGGDAVQTKLFDFDRRANHIAGSSMQHEKLVSDHGHGGVARELFAKRAQIFISCANKCLRVSLSTSAYMVGNLHFSNSSWGRTVAWRSRVNLRRRMPSNRNRCRPSPERFAMWDRHAGRGRSPMREGTWRPVERECEYTSL
jgi:hypothetical protein